MSAENRTFPKSVQPGIPKIGEVPETYTQYKFGDLFEVVQRPVKLQDSGKYDLVTVKRARGGIARRSTLRGDKVAVKSQYRLAEDDFLISKRQIVHGACGIVSDEFTGSIVSNEYSVLRCKPILDLQYLGYLSHTIYFQQTCFHSSIGVHIEKMIFKLDDWFKWPINLPSLPEQKKIAAFLGVVDAKIAGLKARQEGLERYKRGLMQALFSQRLRFTKPDGSGFPDWEYRPLGDIFDYEQPTKYIVSSTDYQDRYPTPVLTAGKSFILGYTDENYGVFDKPLPVIIFDDFTTASKLVDFPFKVKSSAMKILRPKEAGLPVSLFFDFLQSVKFHVGDHKRHWISEFSEIEVPFPHSDEQQKIADALQVMDAKIAAVAGQVAKMEDFKKGLLQQMFV